VDLNRKKVDGIIKELRAFTSVSSNNSKNSDSMADEYYYMYLRSKIGALKTLQFDSGKTK